MDGYGGELVEGDKMQIHIVDEFLQIDLVEGTDSK